MYIDTGGASQVGPLGRRAARDAESRHLAQQLRADEAAPLQHARVESKRGRDGGGINRVNL